MHDASSVRRLRAAATRSVRGRLSVLGLAALLAAAVGAQVCTTTTIAPGDFNGVAGNSDSNVVAVGKNGTIYKFNGTSWNAQTSPTGQDLRAVSMAPDGTAFAVGDSGTIVTSSGGAWSTMTTPTTEELKGVWAASANAAWAVGENGTLLAWDGTSWTSQSGPAGVGGQDLKAVWGDANTVYALGKDGTLYPFDRGTGTWGTPISTCATGPDYTGLWGDGAGNLYLTTDNGRVYHYDGSACTQVASTGPELKGISGSAATGEIYAVGENGAVLYYDGSTWQASTQGAQDIKGVWVSSAGNAYMAGKNGQSTTCGPGGGGGGGGGGPTCQTTNLPGGQDVNGISGNGDGNVVAVGDNGTIAHFDGTTWSAAASPTGQDLNGVSMAADGSAIAVGDNGALVQYSGGTWSTMASPTGQDMNGVWAASATEAWAVGENGVLLAWDGSNWTSQSGPAGVGGQDVEAVWGDANAVYALGKNGRIYTFDRTSGTWAPSVRPCSTGPDYTGIWGDGSGNLYLSADNGGVYRYDGSTCTLVATATQDLNGISGSAATGTITAVGDNGTVLAFDGSTWQQTNQGASKLNGVWVSNAGNAYYAANNGAVTVCSTPPALAHFAVAHDGSAVNCQAEPVTLSAHKADHTVETGYTGTVTLSTSTGHGDWTVVSGAGVLVNSGNGAATYAFDAADAGVITLGLKDTFVETLNIDAADGGASEDASEDPDLGFAQTGFSFLAGGVPDTIGTQIAGKASNLAPGAQSLEVQAVRTSPLTGACESALQGAVAVDLAFECVDPAACGVSQVSVNGTGIAANPSGGVVAYTPVALDFGGAADTTAPIVIAYPDAGSLRLHARYDIPLGGGGASGNLMTGAGNVFVVRPFGFDVDFSGDRAANGIAGVSYAADAAGSRFVEAGEPFSTTVRAVAWSAADDADANGVPDPAADLTDNAATPAFGTEATPATASVGRALVAPAAGNPGNLGGGPVSGFAGGVATASLTWDEVGIIDLTSVSANYLGGGADVRGTAPNLGRFYPARLTAADAGFAFRDGPDVAWTCAFTYMDQPFAYAVDPTLTVTARNRGGGITLNYGGAYWKLTTAPFLANRAYADAAGTAATLDAPAAGTVALTGDTDLDGQGTLTLSGEIFGYLRPAAGFAPFGAAVDLTVPAGDLTDTDGVCRDPVGPSCNTHDGATGVDYAVTGIGGTSLRFGRMALVNAAGSELLDLAVPALAQYHDGSGFIVNAADSCTAVGTAHLDLANDLADPPPGTATIAVGAGSSTASIANAPLAAGDAGLGFSAPGAGNTGHVDLLLDLSTATGAGLPWLRFDWDGDGTHLEDPTARATFGIYQGSPNLIHLREPWN